MRLTHEADCRPSAWFVTLTYSPENIPENGALDPEDFRQFVKRLRRRVEAPVSYYVCGEYGETTFRPHYHAVLYGPAFLDKRLLTHRSGAPVWTSETLDAAWRLGISEFTALTYGNASYAAGYVRKKVRHQDDPDHYIRVNPSTGELVQLPREFNRQSTRPAIGRTWIEKYWRDVYPRDFVVVNGFPKKPPRYYDKFMDLPEEKGGCNERRELLLQVREQRYKDIVEIGDEKLIMKEKVHRARIGLYNHRDSV